MLTVKLKYKCSEDLFNYVNQFNWVYRYAYNRKPEHPELSLNGLVNLVKESIEGVDLLDYRFILDAVKKASVVEGNDKAIFGGRKLRERYLNKEISKEEYRKGRHVPLTILGACDAPKGNRKFKLDIANSQVVFQPKKGLQYKLEISGMSRKQKADLEILQAKCELNEAYFNCSFDHVHVYLSYDETAVDYRPIKPVQNRILSLDMNPNYIAFIVADYDKDDCSRPIQKEVISVKGINFMKHPDYKSLSKEDKKKFNRYKDDKLKTELCEVSKRISDLAAHYRCETVAIEKLSIQSSDKKKGKIFNKLCNNSWCRTTFVNNLTKWCNIYNIKIQEVVAQYSSFIGQFNHPEEVDSVAAAIEIGRRCNLFIRNYIKKENLSPTGEVVKCDIVYPRFPPSEPAMDHWKKKLPGCETATSWKSLYGRVKEAELRYRTFINEQSLIFSSLKSCRSKVRVYRL